MGTRFDHEGCGSNSVKSYSFNGATTLRILTGQFGMLPNGRINADIRVNQKGILFLFAQQAVSGIMPT
jgi:hypothetical protein